MGALARYNMTRVELKTFTFSAGSKFLSKDMSALDPVPKPLFTMDKNADFIGSQDTNPYKVQHYINEVSLFENGKHVPNEGLSLGMDHEKTSAMSYRTLFEGPGARRFQSPALLYPVLPQVSKIRFRNQNGAFSPRMVDVLSAELRFRRMPSLHDTSYCRFCCSPINRSCTSTTPSLCSRYDGI